MAAPNSSKLQVRPKSRFGRKRGQIGEGRAALFQRSLFVGKRPVCSEGCSTCFQSIMGSGYGISNGLGSEHGAVAALHAFAFISTLAGSGRGIQRLEPDFRRHLTYLPPYALIVLADVCPVRAATAAGRIVFLAMSANACRR